ncbi:uncharacterized protein V1510DRAFT_420562 [Dipodascopsis tothii]|uniref:uncharacterized protein n=1 Tax=Dipodascopsis tothii TaxID=44089 RepID=UPI0034CE6EF3
MAQTAPAVIEERTTLRDLDWNYALLQVVTEPAVAETADEMTWYRLIDLAVVRSLGLMGQTIACDILKVDGLQCYVRVAAGEQFREFCSAISGFWVDNRTLALVEGAQRVGLQVARTSPFAQGIVGPARGWAAQAQ